jgi:hypothetical protein
MSEASVDIAAFSGAFLHALPAEHPARNEILTTR